MTWQSLSQEIKRHDLQLDVTLVCPAQHPEHALPSLEVLPQFRWRQFRAANELTDWLGQIPQSIHCRETSLAIAVKTFHLQTAATSKTFSQQAGVSVVLPSAQESTVWLSVQTAEASHALEYDQPHNNDASNMVSLLKCALEQTGLVTVQNDLFPKTQMKSHHAARGDEKLFEVWRGIESGVWRLPSGEHTSKIEPAPRGVLCGSFNPLHVGHQELRDVAEQKINGPVYYELALSNADKPPLDFFTIEQRASQFTTHPLFLTNAPTFASKAKLLPGTIFIVGYDTAERILQPRFYGQNSSAMCDALDQIRKANCKFLVAGRLAKKTFHTAGNLLVPPGFEDLFETLPESAFRRDVSSTQLRNML